MNAACKSCCPEGKDLYFLLKYKVKRKETSTLILSYSMNLYESLSSTGVLWIDSQADSYQYVLLADNKFKTISVGLGSLFFPLKEIKTMKLLSLIQKTSINCNFN